ncbi:MAG: hypothetical protein AAF184_22145 [Pseudomonadota bacterium]
MMTPSSRIAAAFATALLAGLATAGANAATVTYQTGPGLQLDIPDDSPVGVSSSIDVGDSAQIIRVGLLALVEHTWAGDLIWTLTGPDGTEITLADRPGGVDGGVGDSSNLSASTAIIFGDNSPVDAEEMGGGSCDSSDSIIGVDCMRWFAPDDALSTFAGTDTLGTWTLFLTDNAGLDTGFLDGWLIAFEVSEITAVPIPSAFLLMASALVGAGALRRQTSVNA